MKLLGAAALAVAAAGLDAAPAADGLMIEGTLRQGGLAIGRARPGAALDLDGRPLAVLPDGRFVVGFGRDAKPEARLRARLPDGSTAVLGIAVARRSYPVQRIDGLPDALVSPPPAALARIRAEAEAIRAARATLTMTASFADGFRWPVAGTVTGVYGSRRVLNGRPRRPHLGIDVAAPRGTPVRASAGGTVALAEADLYFTGGTVIIDHGLGLSSAYSHLSALSVGKGDRVDQGDVVGVVGATGRSTGPHLDWRINWFQERLDPALIAGPMPRQ